MIIALSLVHEALVFMWDVCSVANVWNCSVTARKSEGKVPRNVDYIFFKRCIAWVLIEVDDFSACCVEVVQVPDVFWGTLSLSLSQCPLAQFSISVHSQATTTSTNNAIT